MNKQILFSLLLIMILLTGCSVHQPPGTVYPNLTINNNTLNYNGNFNITGEIYYTQQYAEGYFHNHTNPLVINFPTSGTFVNLTNFTAGSYNGFVFEGNGVTVQEDGIYKLDGTVSFSGGNNGEYGFILLKNGIPQEECGVQRTTSSSAIGNVGGPSCIIELHVDDHLNIAAMDQGVPTQPITIEVMNMNIYKIAPCLD